MAKAGVTKVEDLPMVMHVKDVSNFLRIAERRAYELVKQPGCPVVMIDGSIKIHRDQFIEWWNGLTIKRAVVELGA